jgi:thermostable 8-oxoguanine DNA glycosylase
MTIIADFGKRWILTDKDVGCSHYRHQYERNLVGISDPLNRDMLFPVFEYVMLSRAQNTPKLIKVFNKISRHNFNTPENVLRPENHEEIVRILKETRFPNVKTKNFFDLAEWWKKDLEEKDIVGDLVKDINSGGNSSVYLRDALPAFGPKGMGYKIASLLIQTATPDLRRVEVVTVDKWILQFLNDIGYEFRVPDYRTVSGISSNEYLEAERIVSEKARDCSLAPGEFGYALWCKSSYTEPNRSICDFF